MPRLSRARLPRSALTRVVGEESRLVKAAHNLDPKYLSYLTRRLRYAIDPDGTLAHSNDKHQPGSQPAQFGEPLVAGQSLPQQLFDRALQDAAWHYSCRHDVVLLLGGFPDLPRETTSFYFYSAGGTRTAWFTGWTAARRISRIHACCAGGTTGSSTSWAGAWCGATKGRSWRSSRTSADIEA
jgi:hypothetical protein